MGRETDMPGRDTRERVLRAGSELLDETGDLEQVSMRGVARRVGIRAPSLYRHVGTVEDLRRAVVARAALDLLDRVAPALDLRAPDRALAAFASSYVAFARDRPLVYRLLATGSEVAGVPPEVRARARALAVRIRDLLGAVLGVDPDDPLVAERGRSAWLELHGIASLPGVHLGISWGADADLVAALLGRALDAPALG